MISLSSKLPNVSVTIFTMMSKLARVGQDGNGLLYSGNSSIIDPAGNIVFEQMDTPCIHTATLNYDRIREYRKTFAAWQDADGDLVLLPR